MAFLNTTAPPGLRSARRHRDRPGRTASTAEIPRGPATVTSVPIQHRTCENPGWAASWGPEPFPTRTLGLHDAAHPGLESDHLALSSCGAELSMYANAMPRHRFRASDSHPALDRIFQSLRAFEFALNSDLIRSLARHDDSLSLTRPYFVEFAVCRSCKPGLIRPFRTASVRWASRRRPRRERSGFPTRPGRAGHSSTSSRTAPRPPEALVTTWAAARTSAAASAGQAARPTRRSTGRSGRSFAHVGHLFAVRAPARGRDSGTVRACGGEPWITGAMPSSAARRSTDGGKPTRQDRHPLPGLPPDGMALPSRTWKCLVSTP